MNKIGLILFSGFCFSLASVRLTARSDDPGEIFLKAYMTSQQGEKLEHDNQFQTALAKFRFAGSLLEELRKTHADWQPAIVEYRSRRIGENIVRVQEKLSTQRDLAASAPAVPAPDKPGVPGVTGRRSDDPPSRGAETHTSIASDAVLQEATKKLREKVDQLQTALEKARNQFTAVEKEKEALSSQLREKDSKLEKAQTDLEKTRSADQEARGRLAQAEDSLKNIEAAGGTDAKAQVALRTEITQLQKALSFAQEGRATAEKEKQAEVVRHSEVSSQIAAVTKERNELLHELKTGKQAQERMAVLVAENFELKQKLATTEKTVREISEDKPKEAQEVADVKRELEQLGQQLAASQKQNKEFEGTLAELHEQLDAAGTELEKAKLDGANAEETARLTKENEMLRHVVVRERQEEARREQTKKLMMAEFEKLQIKSDTLNRQIALLAQPVTKLSPEELALLRQPVVEISETNPTALKASFTVAKEDSGPTKKPGARVDFLVVALAAKNNFERGKYSAAEKQYQQILAQSPNDLSSLSNLGVVYFRTGKLKAAELTLRKALAIAPKDEFSHTTLGIVYYRQRKFDDAITELTKALGINPKNATAHNYLGITASQKGWQEAAEREMLDAIAVNPDYADAHFNLAVVYATAQPPAKELAKQHYTKATSLGAEADSSLENLLR